MAAQPNFPKSGLVWLKASTFASLWKRAFRTIKGVEGEIIINENDDTLTIGLDPRATPALPATQTVVVFVNGGLATLDIYAPGDPHTLP